MRLLHRIAAVLLLLCLMAGLYPTAGAVSSSDILGMELSPDQTCAVVRLQSRTDAELAVALFRQTGQLITLRTVSVRADDSLQEISVPLPDTDGETHTVRAFLLDSATHAPLCGSFTLPCTQASAPAFAVHDVSLDGRSLLPVITTGAPCQVTVDILSEDGTEVLLTRAAEAAANLQMEAVNVYIPVVFRFPAHFLIRVTLTDDARQPLCEPLICRRYTSAYETFLSRTPADFPGSTIQDFGTNGFGVLVDDAIIIDGIAETADDRTYTFSSADSIAAGDILLLTEADGTRTPVKVREVLTQADGTVTILREQEAAMSELYQFLRLDAFLDVGQADQNGGEADLFGDINEDASTLLNIEKEYTAGPLSIAASAKVALEVSAHYDPKLFGEDYFSFETAVHVTGYADATVTGQFSSADLDEPPQIVLRSGFLTFVGSGLASVYLDVIIPLHFNFDATGSAMIQLDTRSGFSYDTDNGYRPFRRHNSDSEFYIEGEFTLSTGLDIALNVSVLRNILSGTVHANAMIVVTGTVYVREPEMEEGMDSIHACTGCCEIDLQLLITATGSLDYHITDKLQGNLLSLNLLSGELPLCTFYFSFLNEEDSIHGGRPTFDFGTCPNVLHRVTVLTENKFGEQVSNIPIDLEWDYTHLESSLSPGTFYLLNGSYTAWASFESGQYRAQFTVEDGPVQVTVPEDETLICCTVIDGETYECPDDAQITITREDGWTRTARVTGDEMVFIVPPGSYTATVEAKGYVDHVFPPFTVINGEITYLEAKLEQLEFFVQFNVNGGTTEEFLMPVYVRSERTLSSLPAATRHGYVLAGWNTSPDGYGTDVTTETPITSDLTLYAVWRPRLPHEYRYHIASVTRPINVLTVMDCATQENYTMQMWDAGDLEDYTFHLVPEANGSYVIVSSFSGLAATVYPHQWDADLEQTSYYGGPEQQWYFEPTDEENTYYIRSARGGYLTRDGDENGSRFILEDTPGGENQKWCLRRWD